MADRDHLIQIVQRIIDLDGSEEEIDVLITEFIDSVPHPEAINVLGMHDDAGAIVDEALSYKPQPMPARWPPSDG